ncbi:MAG: M20/M25/M40 family metallo-hydrolase, partial [Anaerolineales bacterium]
MDVKAHRLISLPFGLLGMLWVAPAMAQAPASPPAQAVSPELIAKVNKLVDADSARLTEVFKDFHQHPEIAFTEVRTSGIVAKELRSQGFEVTERIGKTGVVGVLKNGAGPTVWFRADMDSNSVNETTGLPYAAKSKQRLEDGSEIDVMHACGHDAHVTWMLGMARAMAALKSDWAGTLVVYAQPAEEVGLGAQAMVND